MLKFELVIPAYNEAENLEAVVGRAKEAAEQAGFQRGEFCLVVVENGSSDRSAEVLERLSKSELGDWFRVVGVVQNRGYGFGLWSGLKTVTAPVVGWSHADQQCDPAYALEAAKLVEGDAQQRVLVKGVRSGRHFGDRFVSRVFEFLARIILGLRVHEMNAQPKVFPRALLSHFQEPPSTFAFDLYGLYVAQNLGYELKTIPVEFPSRVHGASKWASTFFSRYKTILGMIGYMVRLRANKGRV